MTTGTFACPICGVDTPHGHTPEQIAAYRTTPEEAARNDAAVLPYDVLLGDTTFLKGVKLSTFIMAAQRLAPASQALELKIFDALGIAPAYRAADPIIAGQIRRPDGKGVLTFFVAWWLDEGDL